MIGEKWNNSIIYGYFTACWLFISPVLLMTLVIISWVKYQPLRLDKYIFPAWVFLINQYSKQH